MELVYAAYQNEKLKFYSFDIDVFFDYLKWLYFIKPNLEYKICKFDIEKLTNTNESFQSLYPELELTEFTENLYMPVWKHREWDEYFRGFYENSLELVKNTKKKIPIPLQDYDRFLEYLGSDRVQSVIGGSILDSVWDYDQHEELHPKFEDI